MTGGRDLAYAHIPRPRVVRLVRIIRNGPVVPPDPSSYRPREISGSGSVGQGAGDVVVGVGPGEWLELDWLGDALLAGLLLGLVPGLCVAWPLALAVAELPGRADALPARWLGAGLVADGASDADPPGAVVAGGDTVRWSAAGESCSAPLASSQATPAPASTVTPAASVVARRRPILPGRPAGECGCSPG